MVAEKVGSRAAIASQMKQMPFKAKNHAFPRFMLGGTDQLNKTLERRRGIRHSHTVLEAAKQKVIAVFAATYDYAATFVRIQSCVDSPMPCSTWRYTFTPSSHNCSR